MRGATTPPGRSSPRPGNFNPRTSCGVRRPTPCFRTVHMNFNPRTSCGVRHLRYRRSVSSSQISIHAPHAGCDCYHGFRGIWPYNFNPRTSCGVRQQKCTVFHRFDCYFCNNILIFLNKNVSVLCEVPQIQFYWAAFSCEPTGNLMHTSSSHYKIRTSSAS